MSHADWLLSLTHAGDLYSRDKTGGVFLLWIRSMRKGENDAGRRFLEDPPLVKLEENLQCH